MAADAPMTRMSEHADEDFYFATETQKFRVPSNFVFPCLRGNKNLFNASSAADKTEGITKEHIFSLNV